MNLKKSELDPTQDLVYTGVRFHTNLGRLYLPDTWIQALILALCKILLQSRGIQTSTPISESAVADGRYARVSRICPSPHAIHPVVPETALDPYNPRVATPDLCQQASGPRSSVVVRQAPLVPGNAVYISQHQHHYHYGCHHGCVGLPLYCARVRHGAIQ